jgi:methylated-DNA-[protein]-cysteine S-methyltransferase
VGTNEAVAVVDSPIGTIGIEATDVGLRRVRLPGERPPEAEAGGGGPAVANAARAARQLLEYAGGERQQFVLDLDLTGVEPTHRRVLQTLREIAPFGTTVTYGELGRFAGVDDPREVGVLMARNPLPLVVPCHRVVAADGLGGYGGGLGLKRLLLELEGVLPPRLELGDV